MLRNTDRIRKNLEAKLDETQLEIRLWESVEIVRKKDGTDFVRRAQSFKNATWKDNGEYSIGGYFPEISVTGEGRIGGWKTFTLYMYDYVDEMRKDDPRIEKANPKELYVRQTYTLSVDECYNRIKARVIQLRLYEESLEKSLASLEDIYNKFLDAIEDVMQNLKSDCFEFRTDDNYPSALEYQLIGEISRTPVASLLR